MENKTTNILLVDDHQLVLDGLELMMSNLSNVLVAGKVSNGQEAIEFIYKNEVHVVLMDINMPVMNGVEACRIIAKDHPSIKILMLSMLAEIDLVKKLMGLGASGYLLKNSGKREIADAIKAVVAGKNYYDEKVVNLLLKPSPSKKCSHQSDSPPSLSRRQKEILQLILDEMTTAEIAEKLNLGFGTIETHRRNMIAKLGVRNTAGLVKAAYEHDLLK